MIQIEPLNMKILSYVKGIHNFPDALYILTLILSIDLGLNFAFEKNLLTFEWSQLTPGIVVVFLAIYIFFSLVANIVLAFFRYILLCFFSPQIGQIIDFFKNNQIQDNNYKKLSKLHEETMKEQNDFKLKVLNEHQMRYNRIANEKERFLSITFKFISLVVIDLHFTKTESSMQFIANQLPTPFSGLVLLSLLVLAILWLRDIFDQEEYQIRWPK